MLLSAVSVLVVAQSISEIPEGLMNNPVLTLTLYNTNRTVAFQPSTTVFSVRYKLDIYTKSS